MLSEWVRVIQEELRRVGLPPARGGWEFSLVVDRSPQPPAKIKMPAKKMSSGRVNLMVKDA